MLDSQPVPASRTVFLTWSVVAAGAGLACFVLPAYLFPGDGVKRTYGYPLIPWFAFAYANLRPISSMTAFALTGLALGLVQPRRWLQLSLVSLILPPMLNSINIAHDWTFDATSHNLFPFEFAFIAFISLPVLPGAFLGNLASRRVFAQATAPKG